MLWRVGNSVYKNISSVYIVLPCRFKSTFVTADLTHTITQKKGKLNLQGKITFLPHLPADLKFFVLADLTWKKSRSFQGHMSLQI